MGSSRLGEGGGGGGGGGVGVCGEYVVRLYILCLILTICNTWTYFINLSSVKHQIINIIIWQCDPVEFFSWWVWYEKVIKYIYFSRKNVIFKSLTDITMVIKFIIMGVNLH